MSKRIDAKKLKLEVSQAIIAGPGAWKVIEDSHNVVCVEAKNDRFSLLFSQEKWFVDEDDSWQFSASLWDQEGGDFLFLITGHTGDSLKTVLRRVCKRLDRLRRGLSQFAPHPIYLTKRNKK
jgi:hypothetical protein